MTGKRKIKRRKYGFILSSIFILNIISIILLPHNTINVKNDEKLIEDPKSLIYTSSIGPPNRHFFRYYKTITINHNQVNGIEDLKNFPVLISLLDSDLKIHVNQSTGNDIAFANDTAWLDHEIELFNQTYNNTHAQLITWVRIPNLHTSIDTVIHMYYGNSTMGPQEKPENVWDSNFKGIWHLSENPLDSPPQMKDSTSNINHGTTSNLESSDQINGQIDGSVDFDGIVDTDLIDCGNDTSLNMGAGEFSLSVWFNYDGVQWGTLAGKGAIAQGKRYRLEFTTPAGWIRAEIDDDTTLISVPLTKIYGDNKWHHAVMVKDESKLRLYIDGIEEGTATLGAFDNLDSIHPFYMNAICGDNSGQLTGWSSVKLDEVRISNSARSADWIATEYNNQYDPSSFYSISEQYKVIKHPVKADYFRYYKEITIDHTMVNSSTDLLNISILISIFDSDLKDHVYSSTGNDIAFAFNATWLDHEIELFDRNYNITHAQLISWVRIPILSTLLDTIVYMYYGNSTMGSRENPKGVWDSNYKGVWHLKENPSDPAPQFFDSTAYNNNGTAVNLFSSNQTSGKIDGGLIFNDQNEACVNVSDDNSLDLNSDMTISAWIKTTDSEPDVDIVVTKWSLNPPNQNYWLGKLNSTDFAFYVDSTQNVLMDLNLVNDSNWHYVVGVADSANSLLRIYLDGVQKNAAAYSGSSQTGTHYLNIGRSSGIMEQEWNGKIDEVRVSNTTRSGGWIKTEYNNQYNPQAFMALGLEEELKIIDDTPPTYSDLTESSDPLRVGQNITISINVYDIQGSGVKQVLLEYDSSNHTMVFMGGNTWSWNKWKPSIGVHVYKIFMEDMANNWNMTSGTITVVEATAPIIENVTKSKDPLELGNNVTISVDVFDNETSVSTVFIELDVWNYTMVNVGGYTYEYNWTSSSAGIVYYTIYANDSVNNWGFINDSILVQDTTPPFYSNLLESADPLELGDKPIISVDIYDIAGINQTFIEIEGVNHSMENVLGNTWEYSSWTPNNWIIYQYKIHTEDNNGNWNTLITNITIQDTTPPPQLLFAINPSGDVSGIIVFDWLDGEDPSGIAYYILIIDNESDPLATPGYVYIFNITNTGTESSYCELPEILPPGTYHFFLAQVDGAGLQGNYTKGIFTVISVPGNNIFLIIVIILVSVIGSATAIVVIRKKLKKDIAPPREKIPLKIITSHLNKLSSAQLILKAEKIRNITDEKEIETRINEIKSLGEQLFAEGAYLEAQKQFKVGRDLLINLGREEEAKLFSELFSGIEGLIEEREKRLETLEQVKLEGNVEQVFDLYHEIIAISKKLRDPDTASFYQSELINYFQKNINFIDLENYRYELNQKAGSLIENNIFEIAAQLYEKCEIISQLFVQLGKEEEISNIEKFKHKKEECLKNLK